MAEEKKKILWVDDEIDLLRSHVMFMADKGYKIDTVTNAEDAIDMVRKNEYDLVLLDEMLHGMDGLTALTEMKDIRPGLPVIMVTKSEEETLMGMRHRELPYQGVQFHPESILTTEGPQLMDNFLAECDRESRGPAAGG